MAADVYRVAERVAVAPVPAPAPLVEDDDVEHVDCAYGVENPYVLVPPPPAVRDIALLVVSMLVVIVTVVVFALGFHPLGH